MNKSNAAGLPNGIQRNLASFTVHYNGKKIGKVTTLDEAIILHDKHKLKHVQDVANEYKDKVPENVYRILMNWIPDSLKKTA